MFSDCAKVCQHIVIVTSKHSFESKALSQPRSQEVVQTIDISDTLWFLVKDTGIRITANF